MFMVCVKLFFVAIVGSYTMSKMIMTARVAVNKATLDSSCAALHIPCFDLYISRIFVCYAFMWFLRYTK